MARAAAVGVTADSGWLVGASPEARSSVLGGGLSRSVELAVAAGGAGGCVLSSDVAVSLPIATATGVAALGVSPGVSAGGLPASSNWGVKIT